MRLPKRIKTGTWEDFLADIRANTEGENVNYITFTNFSKILKKYKIELTELEKDSLF